MFSWLNEARNLVRGLHLDDGTMIVVEHGAQSIGKEVAVVIASVLQTSAGRMIFAELEAPEQDE